MAGIIFSLRHDRIRSDGARQLTVHVTSFPFPFPYYIYIYIIYRQAIFVDNIIIYAKLPLLRNLQHRLPTSSRRTIPTAHLLIKFFLIQIKYPTAFPPTYLPLLPPFYIQNPPPPLPKVPRSTSRAHPPAPAKSPHFQYPRPSISHPPNKLTGAPPVRPHRAAKHAT